MQAVLEKSPAKIVFPDKIVDGAGMGQIAPPTPVLSNFANGVFPTNDILGTFLPRKPRPSGLPPHPDNAHIILHIHP
jgi:hypothetical protein